MAGKFELFRDGGVSFRFRLKASDGTVLAVSGQFSDKASAVEGISAVRECAGMGLITDLCLPMPPEEVMEQGLLPAAMAR
ncbi:YegP family protein [Arthrobacter burdickii]|uniref:YegP family protein n=1 Tax=Arthrobacter burdickii TaxID=3035920 RepID=UPI003425372C